MDNNELLKWIKYAFGELDALFSPNNIFEVIKTDQNILRCILLGGKFDTKEKTDSTHTRIKKFNQLIDPQLLELNDRELELAKLFLLGYLKKYVSVEEIEEISDELGAFIERDL